MQKSLIVFSGLDGAGKSTQIELLIEYYKNSESKVYYFWSRGGYTPGIQNFKKCMRRFNSNKIPVNQGHSKERDKSFNNPLIRKVWLSLAIIDLIFFYGIYLRYKSYNGFKIICDRYIFDTSLDFRLNFPQENVNNWLLWKLMLFFAMKPYKHFVLTIPIKESLRRSKLKNEPFPDSEETLSSRLSHYLRSTHQCSKNIHINGTDSVNKIHKFVINQLN